MPRNVYHEINLHIVWRTLNSNPVLIDLVEDRCHRYLMHRAANTPGVYVHAINGTADHIHLAVTTPPTLLISEWIGQLKGASAHYINNEICNRKVLEWQSGYGVVSFGTRNLAWVIDYIRRQKQHHHECSVQVRLERIEQCDAGTCTTVTKPVETG